MEARCGYQGERNVLEKVFFELEDDENGMCSDELNQWMRNMRRTRQGRMEIVRTLTLTSRVRESVGAWCDSQLHTEIQSMLRGAGVCCRCFFALHGD